MAVYTSIDKATLESFLENYELGKLLSFTGIQEGVENSTYKLIMSTGSYILSIFEKRVNVKEVTFFIQLKNHLIAKNFACRKPISNKKGDHINQIKNKSCVILSFLEGKNLSFISENHCLQLGKQLSSIHMNASDFKLSRVNSLSQKNWRSLFENIKNNQNTEYSNLFELINTELDFLDKNWPKNLPSGIIHGDLFQDNVLFNNNMISGIIDFYFACNDYYAYELAICINAWCFNSHNKLNMKKAVAILNSYQSYRKLSDMEKIALPALLRGAAMRFLLTRLIDIIYHSEDAYVEPKDPMEYFNILNFHQNNNSLREIVF